MAYRDSKYYQENKKSFPADDINPELKKNKEYFMAYAEAMWSEYVSNNCAWHYTHDNSTHSIETLRAYAKGTQSMDPIKDRLCERIDPNDIGKGFHTKMNISWKGYKIMPKMYDIIRSFNSKIDYDINASAIDDDSVEMKETDREYIKFSLHEQVAEFMNITKFKPQMKIDPKEVGAQTESDVDLLMESGGYNLQEEIAAQVVWNKTKKISDFAVQQDEVFDDIFTIGKGGLKCFINKSKMCAEVRRIDPKYAVVQKSRFRNFKDNTRAGEVRYMTIGEIRDETDLTEQQLIDLAKDYSFLNPDWEKLSYQSGYYDPTGGRQDFFAQYGIDPLNDVRIMVLDFEFLSLNIEKFLETKRESTGASIYKKVSYEYELSEKDAKAGATIDRSRVIIKYEAKWIIGSDYFINYGPSEFVRYTGDKGDRSPKLSFHWGQTNNSSIVERCVDFIDDINEALFKRRNAIKSLPPAPRMIIEQGLLDNVELNGKLQDPKDLIRAFSEKGILIVNRLDEFGKAVSTNGKTIEFVPTGIIEDITLFTNEIISGKESVKDVTGVNDITAAETPDERTAVGVSKLAEVASSNALFPTFNTWKYIFEPAAEDTVGNWQILCDDNEHSVAHVPLGANTMQVFKIGKSFAKSKFSLRMEMIIGEAEKQRLLQEITNLKDARRQNGGKGGITGAQYLKLYDLIMAGNRKLAMFILAQVEKLQNDKDTAINAANQAQTFQAQQAAAAAAEKGKQNTYQVEGGVKSNTALVTEASKRKTMLMQALVTPVPDGQQVDKTLIQQQIDITDAEIQQLLQIIHQESMQAQGAGQQQPGQQPQQQLQQAS